MQRSQYDMKKCRIIGLDPGLRTTGWGVIESIDNRLKYIGHGLIQPDEKQDLSLRLACLYREITRLIEQFEPDEAAVEETFMNVNAASALKLGQARGVVLVTPALMGLSVAEYAPNKIKKSVVGAGHAEKSQVIMMMKHLLPGSGILSADAADALAVAVCHAHYRTTMNRWKVA